MEDINKIVGKNLSLLRKKAKLTQMELAEKFNYSDKSISKWESGESLPGIDVLYALAQFYNVSLDSLTSELEPTKIEAKITKAPKKYSSHLVITLLSVCAVWLLATVLYVCLVFTIKLNYPIIFLWSIPVSCIVLIVFNSLWGKMDYLFVILSALIWTSLICLHLELMLYNINFWQMFFVGIPLQIAVGLWAALVRKTKEYRKLMKEERKKEKLEKKSIIK